MLMTMLLFGSAQLWSQRVCLVFNGTFTTNRLHRATEVGSISHSAGGQYKSSMQLIKERIQ